MTKPTTSINVSSEQEDQLTLDKMHVIRCPYHHSHLTLMEKNYRVPLVGFFHYIGVFSPVRSSNNIASLFGFCISQHLDLNTLMSVYVF